MMNRFLYRLTRSSKFVLLSLIAIALPIALAQSSSGGKTERYTITESDYTYSPDQMTWHVGDTVVLTVKNTSPKDPHMFMMGKKPLNYVKTSFGKKYPKGWGDTLFTKPGQVTYKSTTDVLMKNPKPGGALQVGAFALARAGKDNKTPEATITFTVPDKVGTWYYACFEQKGQHYTSHHMVGTIKIVQ